ncbi:MAG: hypothetical protein KA152_07700 [Verrucomicrobiales bacterium]|nr:hypothetical protein [Verrucomicrobiales bacterium]HQW27852.1 hypothetical protein [Verrucomicrobiales bacterium]
MTPRPASLAEVARRVLDGHSFAMELADFLDAFRESPNREALQEEPPLLNDRVVEGRRLDAFLAATGESLAMKHDLPVSHWMFDPRRSLDVPSFACRTRAGRLFLLKDSPAAFKSRNLFVTGNALERV